MRWHYRDAALLWLFPAVYLCHLAEEYFGGFPEWMARIAGAPLPRPAFLAINAVALVLMLAAVRSATRREGSGWMAIAIATIVLVNGLAHLLASLATGVYSPGLLTGIVFYVPLGLLALIRAWHQASPSIFRQGVAAGIAVHTLVVLVAAAATRA